MGGDDCLGVNANSNPAKDTIGDIIAKVDVVEHGIRRGSFLAHDAIGAVDSEGLSVGAVRGNGVDLVVQRLVKEQLTDLCLVEKRKCQS